MRYSINQAMPLLLLLSSLAANMAAAQDAGSQTVTLTLQQAISKALANNPGIETARIDADIERARRDALAQGTPYRLDGAIENIGGTGDTTGLDLSETTLSLSKTIETGNKRDLRRLLGESRLQQADIEIAMREAAVAAEVARRYIRVLRSQALTELASESVAIARRRLDVTRTRVNRGRASEAEAASATVTLTRAELVANRLEYGIVADKVALSTLWGTAEPGFSEVRGNLFATPEVTAFESLRERLPDSPGLQHVAADAGLRRIEQQVASSHQSADIELSAGLRHLALTDDVALVLGFSMPFGSRNRAEPTIREMSGAAARSAADGKEQALQLELSLRTHYQALLAARYELDVLQNRAIPEARRALAEYERGFELGRHALHEVTAAQELVIDLRRDTVDAAASVQFALIEIENLLGNTNPAGALL